MQFPVRPVATTDRNYLPVKRLLDYRFGQSCRYYVSKMSLLLTSYLSIRNEAQSGTRRCNGMW